MEHTTTKGTTTGDSPISVREAASRLGVSWHTLRQWAVYGRLLPYFRLGRRLLFDPADVERFKAAGRVEARNEAGQ